jgi:hypothetical protein
MCLDSASEASWCRSFKDRPGTNYKLSLVLYVSVSRWCGCWFVRRRMADGLQYNTATAALALLKGQQSSTSGSLKHVVDAFAAQAGAF